MESKPRFNYFTYKNKMFDITDDFGLLKVKLNPEVVEFEEFPLVKVEPLTLLVLRIKVKTPFIVIKKEENLYVTAKPVPFNYTFSGATFCGLNHRCSSGPEKTGTCPRLLALPDEMGGCQKVYDYKEARVEKYPWIKFAAETVNTHYPSFIVLKCEHHP